MNATTPSRREIALCIDDFGLHDGVNEATLRLAALHRVTAVSCMTGAPQWRAGASRLRSAADGIDVGLHLDFTAHPLDARMRMTLPALIARSQARLLDARRLRSEIDAQLDAFEDAFGRAPAHVDGHQHVHQFPVIRDVLLDVLLARWPQQRPWVRCTRGPGPAGLKRWLIERLGSRELCALADRHRLGHNARLLGVYDFRGNASRYRSLLAGWLRQARQGDLLMCHPAACALPADPIAAAREREFGVLGSDAFITLLDESNVRLAPLSRLLAIA